MKKNSILIAGILGIVYSIINIYFNYNKPLNDAVIFNYTIIVISLFGSLIILNMHHEQKINNLKLIFWGIFFLVTNFISGLFIFYYLSKPKSKNLDIEKIVLQKVTFKEKIGAFINILIFLFVIAVLPRIIKFSSAIMIIPYIFLIIFLISIYFKDLRFQFEVFKLNFKKYLRYILKNWLLSYAFMFIVSLLILYFKGDVSENQKQIISGMQDMPILYVFLAVIYAPIVEELIFRFSIRKLINNKNLYLIISALLFGTLHVIQDWQGLVDILYIIQYSILGFFLAKVYYKTNNIMTSIFFHFIQNALATILIFLLTF